MKISAAEEVFETWRRRVGVVLAPLAFLLTYWLASNLPIQGRTLAGILAGVAALWVTETLPLPVTALLGAVLCVAMNVAPAEKVFGYFANPIVFVFIGSFMLAQAMSVHKLDRRIALGVLSMRWVGGRPALVLAGVGLVTAIISTWVSNTATTAMMLPIALGILRAMHRGDGPMDARSWPYATGMMLMVAYAASIAIGTPVASPPNLIGISLIQKATGVNITFFKWMALTMPLFVVMAVALFVLLYWLHPPQRQETTDRESMARYIDHERAKLGAWSAGQFNTLIAFGVATVLWITPGLLESAGQVLEPSQSAGKLTATAKWLTARVPESVAGLIAAILLFALPTKLSKGEFTLSWEDAARIDWGTILLFGGGLALGTLMFETGVAKALGDAITAKLGVTSLWGITGLSIALAIVLSEATSNTAAAQMIIPVVIGISQTAQVSPIPPALGACLGASFGFMLPVSTPPNAIVYGSGLVSIPSMMRAGILLDLLGFFIIWGGLRVLCPVLGLM